MKARRLSGRESCRPRCAGLTSPIFDAIQPQAAENFGQRILHGDTGERAEMLEEMVCNSDLLP
jgi:hypothetical protein